LKFEGIYPPAITPLAADGGIDKPAYAQVLEHLVASKVHGIIVGGSTGEYYAHTMQERLDLAAFAKEVLGNRLPLIVGTGAIRTEESITYAAHAKEIGADALLVTSPPYALPNEHENALHALAIDRAANLPIILYNYPGRMGVVMDREYFSRVGKSKNIVAIKESSGSTSRLHMLAREFPHINLSCGYDDQALEFFAWGARSWVCAGANFIPFEHDALYRACVIEKDFDKGRAIMMALMPLMDFLENSGKFVQSIKFGCQLAGLKTGSVRAPLRDLREEQKYELQTIITNLKRSVAQICAGGAHV